MYDIEKMKKALPIRFDKILYYREMNKNKLKVITGVAVNFGSRNIISYCAMRRICVALEVTPSFLLGCSDVNEYEDYVYDKDATLEYPIKKLIKRMGGVKEVIDHLELSACTIYSCKAKERENIKASLGTVVKIANGGNYDIDELYGFFRKE